jgi:hypothetical protein
MALTKVSSSLVSDNAITTGKLVDGGVHSADIATNAITSTKIAQNSILTKHIDDGQVTTDQLGADAVTNAKIANQAIGPANLSNTIITDLTAVTAATGDLLMVADISNSNNLKKIPVSSILAGTHTGGSSGTHTGAVNTSGTIQGARLGLGVAPHGTAGLNITSTAQHIRLNNGSELGVLYLDSDGILNIWAHGDGESLILRTGTGSGTAALTIAGVNSTFAGTISSGVINAFGASGGSNQAYASNFKADSANIQITLERGTDATGWGGIGASGSNAFMVYNESTQQKLTLTQAGNLGIGIDNPIEKLDVGGTAGISVNSNYAHMGSTVSGAMAIFGHNIKSDSAGNTIKSANSNYHSSMIKMYYDEGITFHATSGTATAGDTFYVLSGTTNELMRIANNGNVGIGTTTPAGLLHIFHGSSGSSVAADGADQVVIENNDSILIDIKTPAGNTGGIIFSDPGGRGKGQVTYSHSSDDMNIIAADNINLSGDVLNYSNSAGTGYFHMSGSSSRYADHGFWVADNYQLEVGNAHIYIKTQTSAKDIILGTHNAERMRISGSGYHIGMGTGNHFVIAEDGAGTYLGKDNNSSLRFITANATRMTINNTGTTILTSGATNLGVLQLSSSVATYQLKGGDNLGYMGYFTGGYHRWFGSDGSEDMRLTSTGLVVNNANNYQGIHAKGSNAPCFTLGKNSSSTPEWRMGITGYDGDDFAISTGTSTNDRFRMDPSGNTIIGSANNFTPIAMHDTVATFSARGPIASGYSMGAASAGPRNTRDWFVYSSHTNVGSSVYIHMKTNLWAGGGGAGNTEYTMSCFTYKDYYAYGGDTSPGGYVGWHNWSGSLFNGHLVNNGTLALVQSSYVSSDGYVVLVAKLGASYAQFSIDWCQWAGYPFRERRVTAVTNTASATGAY